MADSRAGGSESPGEGPLGIVVLNLGGPDSPDAVQPFLRNLFSDPDVIQLGYLRPLQGLLAGIISRRRAHESRAAYAQIGGASPIAAESAAQAAAIALHLSQQGLAARGYTAMSCWHPFSHEAVAAMKKDGVRRAVALPLYPQFSYSTTGSAFKALDHALQGSGIALQRVDHYPDAPGYIDALADRIRDAIATLPTPLQQTAPVLFSAHGLPEAYIRKGDPYLDDIRITVAAVTRRLGLAARARTSFQSRVGPQKWLGPSTERALDELAAAGETGIVVCPVAFTGEHIETLQEIDIIYQGRAKERGIVHFARARTVGCHPAFIEALARLAAQAAHGQGRA